MSSPPRLDLLTTDLDLGGAENQLVILASELRRRGWPIRVISMMPPGAMRDRLAAADVPVLSLHMRRGHADPAAAIRLARHVRQQRTRVLLSFMYHANVLGRLAGWVTRVPRIISSMRNERFGSARRDSVLRATDWMGDANVVNSTNAAAAIRERGIVPRRDIRVVPNCIEIPRYHRSEEHRHRIRTELGLEAHTFVWLMIGHLWPQKDHETGLRAFSRIADGDARLVIVGGGPLEDALRETARVLEIASRVEFLGIRDDVPALLSAADGFLLTSAWEGMPNVVMEALAAGLPVVATEVGGVPEIVHDGETGFLAPPTDPAAIAAAMERVHRLGLEQRRSIADRGRALVRNSFGVAAITDLWETVLTDGLA